MEGTLPHRLVLYQGQANLHENFLQRNLLGRLCISVKTTICLFGNYPYKTNGKTILGIAPSNIVMDCGHDNPLFFSIPH